MEEILKIQDIRWVGQSEFPPFCLISGHWIIKFLSNRILLSDHLVHVIHGLCQLLSTLICPCIVSRQKSRSFQFIQVNILKFCLADHKGRLFWTALIWGQIKHYRKFGQIQSDIYRILLPVNCVPISPSSSVILGHTQYSQSIHSGTASTLLTNKNRNRIDRGCLPRYYCGTAHIVSPAHCLLS